MRIVNREEFLKLPNGTMYRKYEPICMDELCMKLDSTEHNDWYVNRMDNLVADSTEEEDDQFRKAQTDSSYEMKMDFHQCQRDGLYDNDQLFAVYSDEDVEGLIKLLQRRKEEKVE